MYLKMMNKLKGLCLLLASTLVLVAGQAPGDESELCTVQLPAAGQNVFNDPPTVRPLMDSRDYEQLLPINSNPVWQRLNLDNSNGGGGATEWIQQGGPCIHQVSVCGYPQGPQDNWLITQHINTTVDGVRLSQLTVQFEYQQTSCPTDGANACQRVFDVLKYETSTIDPAAARDTNNYAFVMSLTTSVSQETQTATVDVALSTQESGFYLAVRDQGTCILFSRVLVFYNVCPAETVNLIVRPETIAPVGTFTPLQVPATCVENASPVGGGAVSLNCLQQGTWLASGGGCECDDGFTASSDLNECILDLLPTPVPSVPQDVRSFPGIVAWRPPAEPNGVITGYEVRFEGTFLSQTVAVDGSESYYVITGSDTSGLGGSILIQVRAGTASGFGLFSDPILEATLPPPPTCPPVTCPPVVTCVCSSPTPCPEPVSCPPVVTCPLPTPCPTPEEPVRFMLSGQSYFDGDTVSITDIGGGDNALLCVTDRAGCCRSSRLGEFFYPSGLAVGWSQRNSLWRDRGDQVVRLNRRNNALSPLGRYRCAIPDSSGATRNIFINISK